MLPHWLIKFWHQFHTDQFTNLAAVCATSNSAGSQLVGIFLVWLDTPCVYKAHFCSSETLDSISENDVVNNKTYCRKKVFPFVS